MSKDGEYQDQYMEYEEDKQLLNKRRTWGCNQYWTE